MSKPTIVAISAVSGGGKTSVVKYLASTITGSKALYFDDYEFDGPDDICAWVKRGADYCEWKLTPLVDDISKLVSESKGEIKWIFLDYPFAYIHAEMKPYIDFTVFIDTPLDIAMARRLLRDYSNDTEDGLKDDLSGYLTHGRDAYIEMLKTVRPNCDVIIDGSGKIEEISNQIFNSIFNNLECKKN